MREDVIERVAGQLLAARRGETGQVRAVASDGPADLAEAYRVQARVASRIGAKIGAWKVGGPLSGQPMMAPIYQIDIEPTPFDIQALAPVGIECEIAFELGRDLPMRRTPYTPTDVADAVVAVLPLVETVWSRLQGFMTAPVFWKLADNQVNGGVVLGKPQTRWSAAMWQNVDIGLFADGREIKRARGANPGGDSLELLTWLANHLGDHLGGLKAGQVVTTGSYTGIDMFAPKTAIQADFGPLGRIAVKI